MARCEVANMAELYATRIRTQFDYMTSHPLEALVGENYFLGMADRFRERDLIYAEDIQGAWAATLRVTSIDKRGNRIYTRILETKYDDRPKELIDQIIAEQERQRNKSEYRVNYNPRYSQFDILSGPPGREDRVHPEGEGYSSREQALDAIAKLQEPRREKLTVKDANKT